MEIDLESAEALLAIKQLLLINRTSSDADDISHMEDIIYHLEYPQYDPACYGYFMTPHVTVSYRIHVFLCLVFIVVGLIGNTLNIIVFSSREMRLVSSNFYLLMLAVSDSMYLICVMCSRIMISLRCLYAPESSIDIFNTNTFMCKLLQFFLDLQSDYSTCLIMAFTIERYIAVYRPLQFKEICTVRKARIICAVLFVTTVLCVAPHHFLFMGRPENKDVCTILPEHETTFTALYIVEILIFRIAPVVSIVTFNILIITRVTLLTRSARNNKRASSERSRIQRRGKNMQLTVILLLVSSTYVAAILPVLIHFGIWKLVRSEFVSISEAALIISQNYTKPLYVLASAINFFLYTLSGGIFREQLSRLLCKFKFTPLKVDATEMMTLV